MANYTMKKLSPVLYVDRIEPCLGFWLGMGFEKAMEMNEGDSLGFVILTKDSIEVMYQSRASLRKDLPALAEIPSCCALYFEVSDLDAVIAAAGKTPPVFPRRRTPYGADEIAYRDAAGNVVMFSMHAQ